MSVFCVGGERERKGERSGWIGLREFVQAVHKVEMGGIAGEWAAAMQAWRHGNCAYACRA